MIGARGGGRCDALGDADLEFRAGRRFDGAAEDPAAGEGDHGEAALQYLQRVEGLKARGEEIGFCLGEGEMTGDGGGELGFALASSELCGLQAETEIKAAEALV